MILFQIIMRWKKKKDNYTFSRSLDFRVFVNSTDFKICDFIITGFEIRLSSARVFYLDLR